MLHLDLTEKEKINITIEIMSDEALKTSEIEEEILDRSSILSSIQKNFGLNVNDKKSHAVIQRSSSHKNFHKTQGVLAFR